MSERVERESENCKAALGGIICIAICSFLLYFGTERLERATAIDYPIETLCNVTHRNEDFCNCNKGRRRLRGTGGSGCSGVRYSYYAYVANCSDTQTFRSSMEDCQKDELLSKDPTKVNVGDIVTCYIEDCSTGEFAWGWDLEEYIKRETSKALWMMIPAAIILSCLCCMILCILATGGSILNE